MTRAVRSRTLKHESGDIGDHLRNHVHLTNCIHLKNHMHKHSPILAERSLMRDLIVLQRSRSLRDPSTSPPSWHSPSIVDSLSKKLAKDAALQEGRGSVRIERRKEGRTLSGSSLPVTSVPTSKVSPGEVSRWSGGGEITGDRSGLVRIRNGKGIQGEELSQKYHRTDLSHSTEDPVQCDRNWVSDLIPGKSEPKDKRSSQKGKYRQDSQLKTLSQQLSELPVDSEDVASSHIHRRSKNTQEEKMRKRKFRGVRRSRASVPSRDIGAHNELSVASNSLAQGPRHPKFHVVEGEGEDTEQNVTRAPRNGCGIPWNWSRIHHRGRTFLDMAGRSLSCGLSDSRLRKGGTVPQGRGVSDIPLASDHSSSSTKSNAEALPLLIEPYGSQESSENAAWLHDYSGELGIFADNGLKNELDSDLASEARSGDQHKFRGHHHGGHRSLTEKYMPRTFRDLVGQNLVAQALSNAVIKRKIGLVYVFYGPHGTGKTSCARIFSRALNCQSSEYSKPCNFCNSCIAHDMGKRQNVREIGPVSNFDFKSIMDLLDNMTVSQLQSQYRVFIFDDCDTLSPDCWSAILKVIDRAPRRVVFVLISTSLDHLPHIILSRCQKFFFPKLKDADIIYTLQWIATKEDLEIDKDALKLIASRSDGSLRDAEMTLEQLSLLGQRISVPLVQELVGLISDDKLVDLLDLALSADTVNTVKNLREIMEAGVEPLPLMSQLATVITDILAGCYEFTKERRRRKFFRHQALSKEDMEKLRQALKTLSEAEKQLRMSNDKITWLTAALLQLAPDRQYMLPSSSENSSFSHSPLGLNNMNGRGIVRKSTSEPVDASNNGRGFSTKNRAGSLRDASTADIIYDNGKMAANSMGGRRNAGMTPQQSSALSTGITRAIDGQISGKGLTDIEEIWLAVLEKIQIDSIKQFMQQEGKLVSVSFGAAPTVQLMFGSHLTKSKIEKFRCHILQAFESVLGSPVTIEIRCEPKKDAREGIYGPIILSASEGESQLMKNPVSVTNNGLLKAGYDNNIKRVTKNKDTKGAGSSHSKQLQSDTLEAANSEIVEILASPRDSKCIENGDGILKLDQRGLESACDGEASSSHQQSTFGSHLERRNIREHQSQSLVRSKVSLAHVIQQAEGCAQRSGWSKRKAISIAEKLEQENLRLEPRSRSLLCWKASKVTRGKLSRLKIRTRRPRSFLKLVPCARCISDKSPRYMDRSFYRERRSLPMRSLQGFFSPSSSPAGDGDGEGDASPRSHAIDTGMCLVLFILVVTLCVLVVMVGFIWYLRWKSRHPNPVSGAASESHASGEFSTSKVRHSVALTPVFSSDTKLAEMGAECSICLSEMVNREEMRVLPRCKHGFHVNCIDKWLLLRDSCPTCRSDC